ncbi:MAG: hypothetical protein LBL95_08995 [Deltaproteobacteria bacterium]|nr:hypothetical protein [Deltaproteobacteria bacterium]
MPLGDRKEAIIGKSQVYRQNCKWIGCDLGRFAIHTSRKRLIGVQRQLKAANALYRSFEILNLGKYERQYFVGINPNLNPEERERQSLQKEEHYVTLILSAYQAQRAFNTPALSRPQGRPLCFGRPPGRTRNPEPTDRSCEHGHKAQGHQGGRAWPRV